MSQHVGRRIAWAVAVALGVLLLAACSSDGAANRAGGRIEIVAGTNVWGDVAAQIGGDRVAVSSLINKPGIDPHEYEAGVKDAAAIARARIVIENGVGYDDFVRRLVDAGHRSDLSVLDVGRLVGAGGDANPHLWYSPDYVAQTARALEALLAKADPSNSAAYEANLATFLEGQRAVVDTVAAIKMKYAGSAVAYTERVAGYLVEAAGLRLGTPASFSRSLEEGNDPSPSDSAAFQKAIEDHTVKVLLYNGQVTDSVTTRLRDLAQSSGVPVVAVTESLPTGKNIQTWQADQARALLAALGG